MPEHIIDCTTLTMNTSITNDKLSGNIMKELKNVDLGQKGRFKKRFGMRDFSNNASPDIPETRINAVQPTLIGDHGSVLAAMIAFGDTKVYTIASIAGAWSDTGLAVTDSFPWMASWGINDAGNTRVYFADTQGTQPVIAAEALVGSAVKYGKTSDASNPWTNAKCVEYYQDKLWVGNTDESKINLNWSVTGDDNDFYTNLGEDSGFLLIRDPGGASTTTGLRCLRLYRDELIVASNTTMNRITGDRAQNYGQQYIRPVNHPNGATMFQVGDFLFWIDMDGIWQFNGATAKNISDQYQKERWRTLVRGDIESATATYNNDEGSYSVFFPTKCEMWNYFYQTGQWSIDTFSSTDNVNVVSVPINNHTNTATDNLYALGTVTNGKVYRTDPSLNTDDGNAITASMTTGNMRLEQTKKRFTYESMDIEAVEQTNAGVLKVTPTIDGVAQTQATLVIAAGAPDTFPTMYDGRDGAQIDFLGMQKTGRYAQFKFEDDDADSRADIRQITIKTKDIE